MGWLFTGVSYLVIAAFVALVIAALLAPFESLGWWAGWSKRWPGPVQLPAFSSVAATTEKTNCYIVYLSGVGNIGPEALTPKERNFLQLLQEHLPNATVIEDVFPYSPAGAALTGPRKTSQFWLWVSRTMRKPALRQMWQIIGIRNILQIAVASDLRYGPVFAFGVARSAILSLLQHGYVPGSRVPIVLVGISGGATIAIGAAARLHRLLDCPVWVVSIGGVLTSDPSICEVEHLYHLSSTIDRVQHVGQVVFPGCWPIFSKSAWNRALRAGKRTVISVGPMRHLSHGDYFSASVHLPNGQSHVDYVVDVVANVIDTKIIPTALPEPISEPPALVKR